MSELGYFGDDRKDTFRKQIIELEKVNAAQAEHIAELEAELAKQIRANNDLLGLLSATASNFTKTVKAYSSQVQTDG